ncbi:MAG: hypothetical protein QME66_07805 [Candidatus Eisenbacteria bacterium]|nr:hypothetical protein [Candidatus Eisenbacteria bacterium]
MAHAYTPGLTVTRSVLLRRERKLPLKGKVLVKLGDKVTAETDVASTELPGQVETVNLSNILGLPPADVGGCLLVKMGDHLKNGQVIARSKSFFGLFKSEAKATCECTLEAVSDITGQAILRQPPIPVKVTAYIDGKVCAVKAEEGVTVEAFGSFIQGIFGVGGETAGQIHFAAQAPDDALTDSEIGNDVDRKIVVGGSIVTYSAIERARERGAKAIIVGGLDDKDLRTFLGYDLGVAITGSEEKGITIIITEGFGRMPMAERTFGLLKELSGKKASATGATQIRAGVLRPEIVVPFDGAGEKDIASLPSSQGLSLGSVVRVIRQPDFGKIGKVTSLPPELRTLETESKVRVLELEFASGEKVILPRANVEIIGGE